jgi:hypothetical protein
MTSDYSPRESLEHEDRARELVEHAEQSGRRFVPLIAAVLAVLAGLSSLYAGRLSERILTLKNEAVLDEVTASDLWSEFQAESVKGHLYEISALSQTGALAATMSKRAAQYKAEQKPLMREARRHEGLRDQELRDSATTERRKASLDVAVALFEISIVLVSIAALARRSWLLAFAGIGGVVALFYAVRGVLP